MRQQYTAVIERERGWYVAHCVEIPGATGQGPTLEDAKESLVEAIAWVLEHQQDPPEAGAGADGAADRVLH